MQTGVQFRNQGHFNINPQTLWLEDLLHRQLPGLPISHIFKITAGEVDNTDYLVTVGAVIGGRKWPVSYLQPQPDSLEICKIAITILSSVISKDRDFGSFPNGTVPNPLVYQVKQNMTSVRLSVSISNTEGSWDASVNREQR